MAEIPQETATRQDREKRRGEEDEPGTPATGAAVGPPSARVRDDDLEPHEGLRYIAKLFKALALLLIFMLIAEMIIGFQQDGTAALGTLLIEATRLIVFAAFLWAGGDLAVMLIESNHDLRASRILLGRLNGKVQRLIEQGGDTPIVRDSSTAQGQVREDLRTERRPRQP